MTPRASLALRVVAALATLGNLAFNFGYARLGLLPNDVPTVSAQYQSAFTPAGFTFAIWGVIYTSWLVLVGALVFWRHARDNRALDALVPGFIALNALCSAWIVAFSFEALWTSVAIIAVQLALGAWLLVRATRIVEAESASVFTPVPLALFTGWIGVAAIANVATALVADGVLGQDDGPPFALAMLAVAAVLGVVGAVRTGSGVPAVIAWAAFGIHRANLGVNPSVSTAAVCVAIGLALLAAWAPAARWGAATAARSPLWQRHGYRGSVAR